MGGASVTSFPEPRLRRAPSTVDGRTIVLLQGPVGPFFDRLRHALAEAGYSPVKINFNGGDWLYSRGAGTLNFRGDLAAWRDWFAGFLANTRPEAVFLFGDQRPMHREAVIVAAKAGIPVWSFEEGYLRPHYVTFEPGGNNALSPLVNVTGVPAEAPPELPKPVHFKGSQFTRSAIAATVYAFAKFFGQPAFAGYRHHRRRGLVAEAILWLRNAWRKQRNGRRSLARMADLVEHHDRSYFVVALQVVGDLQLVHHGRGWTMERLISESIVAFARAARPGHRLVFKAHPMDRGHTSHERFIRELARLSGIEDRVDFLDDGSIGLLIRHARGVVTVNSTSGFSAIHHAVPLLAMGSAPYGRTGLARDGAAPRAMDSFFADPGTMDEATCARFLAWVRQASLVNGSFYLPGAASLTCRNVIERFERDNPALLARVVPLPAARAQRSA